MDINKTANYFWSHVDIKSINECWEWTGAKDKKKYGLFSNSGRGIHAHRMSWILVYGEYESQRASSR